MFPRALLFLVFFVATNVVAAERPRIQAVRLTETIRVDGRLEEAVWSTAPAATAFTQRQPNEGTAASEETEVRFAFDDGALFVGARMRSAQAAKIADPVTRRDNVTQSEHILISLDTWLDRRTAWTFGVTAGGTRVDRYHPIDSEAALVEASFDPVWEAKVARDADGWTAEMRIPFAQLRYNDTPGQTWGVNIRRSIPTKNETDYWVLVPRKEAGWASRFGELTGIEVRRARRVEMLPYVSGTTRLRESATVFEDARTFDHGIGADIKAGIGPNLTLDATINPDFGQVEADPAVVNLSAYETIYPERRPFFVEGSRLLSGGGQSWFYSRRIGAPPPSSAILRLEGRGLEVSSPRTSGILGAAKLTGRFAGGTSVGALVAVTDRELARTWDDTAQQFAFARVAPRTLFGVARGEQQFGTQGSTIGFTITGVGRELAATEDVAALLNRNALGAGTDWNVRLKNGEYEFGGYAGLSRISGTPAAITRAQRSSARYFQRPDAEHVAFDPTRESLSGWTGGVRMERLAGKHWLWYASVDAISPGFEINDAGRLRQADSLFAFGQLRYRETEGKGPLRDYELSFQSENGFNHGGVRTWTSLRNDTYLTWKNFWTSRFTAWMDFPALDDDLTRGGPLMGTPRAWVLEAALASSTSARNTWRASLYRGESEAGERTWRATGAVAVRPQPRWQLSVEPTWFRGTDPRLWFTTLTGAGPAETYNRRYVFSFIDRDEVSLRLRANYALTPDLTFEVYGEPFAASGRYHDFGELPAARSRDLRFYGRAPGTSIERLPSGAYAVRAGGASFTLDDRDYNVRSFRSNAVVRWEWRPGTTMYLVWQQDRAATRDPGTARFTSLGESLSAGGDNIVAIKISYWLPM